MNTINFILAGLGGQGILYLTKVLAQTAMSSGLGVLGAETHGMAQRGGSVVSHLRLGDARSSLVRPGAAQFLLALEESEAYRNLPFLGRGGLLCANAPAETFPLPEVGSYLDKMEIKACAIPASQLAQELSLPRSANLALLGYFSACGEGPFTVETLRETVAELSPDPIRERNMCVFDAGYEKGLEYRKRQSRARSTAHRAKAS
jgi:indolepyruvate ferredoxin oxidoreductase beta subunit